MSLLRPGVIKQHKPFNHTLSVSWMFTINRTAEEKTNARMKL